LIVRSAVRRNFRHPHILNGLSNHIDSEALVKVTLKFLPPLIFRLPKSCVRGGHKFSRRLRPPPALTFSATVLHRRRALSAATGTSTEASHARQTRGIRKPVTFELLTPLDSSACRLALWKKYRCQGSGPTFRKLGGRVVYALDDLEAWADQSACRSTSDPRYVEARDAGKGENRPVKRPPPRMAIA